MLRKVQAWIERKLIFEWIFGAQCFYFIAGIIGVFQRWPSVYVPMLICMVAMLIAMFTLILLKTNAYQ